MVAHLKHKKPFGLGKLLGIIIIVFGTLQILSLLNYFISPVPKTIILWATGVGSIIGGLRLLIQPRHGIHHLKDIFKQF